MRYAALLFMMVVVSTTTAAQIVVRSREENITAAAAEERPSLTTNIIYGANQDGSKSDSRVVPSYVKYLLNMMNKVVAERAQEMDPSQFDSEVQSKDKLFDAWLPVQIKEIPASNLTVVTFRPPLSEGKNYTSSRITLTLRDDIEVTEPLVRMFVSIATHSEVDSLEIDESVARKVNLDRKFCTFRITNFITSRLQQNDSVEHNLVQVSFQLYTGHDQDKRQLFDFKRYFDVEKDLPVVVNFYSFPKTEKNTAGGKRTRRSVGNGSVTLRADRPLSHCQRRELEVTPAQVGWNNVIEPSIWDIGFCGGLCQFPLHDRYYNFTIHSFLLDRLMFTSKDDVIPSANCGPVTYRPLSVIQLGGDNRFEAGVVHNIAVESCGCIH